MTADDYTARLDWVCKLLRSRAKAGTWDGREPTPYFRSCRFVCPLGPETAATAVYTRDVGHHTCGWWKNPDYEQCRHLSLSFVALPTAARPAPEPLPRDVPATRKFLGRLFGPDQRLLWCEPPYSPTGKRADVWHYRLFCNPAWEPIRPRGEVYSKELTEAGWLSFSDVRAGVGAAHDAAREQLGNALADGGPVILVPG